MGRRLSVALALALACAARTARADDPPEPPPPPDPPAGVARAALGVRDPLRTSLFDITVSGPPANRGYTINPQFVDTRFALSPRWAFVDTPTDWAWAGMRLPWSIYALEGGESAVRIEDLEIHAAYSRTLVRSEGGLLLLGGPRLAVATPTSSASQGAGVSLRPSVGVGLDLHVPLHHGPWFPGLFVSGNAAWEHTISKYSGVVSGGTGIGGGSTNALAVTPPMGLDLLDQNRFFSPIMVLNGGQVGAYLSVWLTIFHDLSVGTTWGFGWEYLPVITGGGVCGGFGMCPTMQTSFDHLTNTTVDFAASYTIADLVWLAVGYNNTMVALSGGPSSPTLFLFDRSTALAYGQVGVLFDGIWAKVATEPTASP